MKSFKEFMNEADNLFKDEQIKALKKEYDKINKIDPSSAGYKKMTDMLDKLKPPALKQLANADIKFVSSLARNRLNRSK